MFEVDRLLWIFDITDDISAIVFCKIAKIMVLQKFLKKIDITIDFWFQKWYPILVLCVSSSVG